MSKRGVRTTIAMVVMVNANGNIRGYVVVVGFRNEMKLWVFDGNLMRDSTYIYSGNFI